MKRIAMHPYPVRRQPATFKTVAGCLYLYKF